MGLVLKILSWPPTETGRIPTAPYHSATPEICQSARQLFSCSVMGIIAWCVLRLADLGGSGLGGSGRFLCESGRFLGGRGCLLGGSELLLGGSELAARNSFLGGSGQVLDSSGRTWAALGCSWAALGGSWATLGRLWVALGRLLDGSRQVQAASGQVCCFQAGGGTKSGAENEKIICCFLSRRFASCFQMILHTCCNIWATLGYKI